MKRYEVTYYTTNQMTSMGMRLRTRIVRAANVREAIWLVHRNEDRDPFVVSVLPLP